MSTFHPGDRVRVECTGDDGYPLVRYGFVGDGTERDDAGHDGERVVVLLDDDMCGQMMIDRSALLPVTVTTVELRLEGADLLHDPSLRQGLVNLWSAEAEAAGLEIGALHHVGTGVRDSSESYLLAELTAGGEQYVLRAVCVPNEADIVRVRADRPNRWDV